ncbi:MAG: aminoglycoside phosphotransferase, partial [Prevotellaceae bacterium]|nr:aminoglycoside phosphotransferase [Prevotellaceae bacterium]
LCVIDLDTVMPSFIFSDYGDFLRTAANTVAEDEADFSKIEFRHDIFRAFTEGYLSSARSFLTPLEIQMLPFAVKLFPYMQSVRFLWDYLNGDEYWKVKYSKHNLVRALNQFELVKRIEQALPEITAFIEAKLAE